MAVPEPEPDAVYEYTELGKCLGDVLNDLVERGALPFAARTDAMKMLDDAVAKELGALSGESATARWSLLVHAPVVRKLIVLE